MKVGSLFSGIGAPEYAWRDFGWDFRWCAEIDKFPSAVLAHRFPGTPNLGDVTKVDWNAVEPVDLLVFGSPCQSFSIAGKRLGLDDPRGNLALFALGVARQLRPKWLVFENVPGLLSSDEGRDFGAFLGLMGECGYHGAWRVMDAQFAGVPQRRRRVFVVGHLGDWRRAAAVLFERASLQGNPPPRREAGEGSAPGVARCLNAGRNQRIDGESETFIARPLRAQSQPSHRADSDTYVAHALRADGFDASEDGTGRGTPLVAFGWQNSPSQGASASASASVTPTLDKSKTPAIAFSSKDHGADAGDLAPTLRAIGHSRSHANAGGQVAVCEVADTLSVGANQTTGFKSDIAAFGGSVRRLTPRECERLQGFPDDWTLVEYRGKPAADGPRYKAIGNSMAVPVMRWIGKRIATVETVAMRSAA